MTPETGVICMYLESVNDGPRLTAIARKSAKPILIHKANICPMSSSVAHSHTAALANDDQVVDAAFKQCGIVRFKDMHGYIDFVKVLQLPKMPRQESRHNLTFRWPCGRPADAASRTRSTHRSVHPTGGGYRCSRAKVINLANPLDLGDLFDFDEYVRIVEQVLQEDSVDGVLFLHTYLAAIEGEASRSLLQKVASLSAKYGKPVAMCVFTEKLEISQLHGEVDFPIFMSPERAVDALAASIEHYRRRESIDRRNKAGTTTLTIRRCNSERSPW